jgi:eukaryotic-like serine/threonine-protein kinase
LLLAFINNCIFRSYICHPQNATVLPLVVIIMLNLIAVPAISLQYILAKGEFLSYENKDFGFSIQYPSDWTKEEESTSKSSNVNIVVSFVKQNGSQLKTEADLYIRTEEFLGKNITLEKFAQLEKAYTSSLLAVSSFNESKTVIGNKSALQIEYDFKGFGGTVRHGINSLIINDDIGYSLVFTVDKEKYDKYLPIAQKMANSFEILR